MLSSVVQVAASMGAVCPSAGRGVPEGRSADEQRERPGVHGVGIEAGHGIEVAVQLGDESCHAHLLPD